MNLLVLSNPVCSTLNFIGKIQGGSLMRIDKCSYCGNKDVRLGCKIDDKIFCDKCQILILSGKLKKTYGDIPNVLKDIFGM